VCASSRQSHGRTERTRKKFARHNKNSHMVVFVKTSAYTSFSQTGRERRTVPDYFATSLYSGLSLFFSLSQTVGHGRVVCRSFPRFPPPIPLTCSLFTFLSRSTRLPTSRLPWPAYIKPPAVVVSAHTSITVDKNFTSSLFTARRPLKYPVSRSTRKQSDVV
jgi:hypothetical protein